MYNILPDTATTLLKWKWLLWKCYA